MSRFVMRSVPSGIKFDLKATNGQTSATSEVYRTRASCRKGMESVQKNAPVAGVEDHTVPEWQNLANPKFELYRDKRGEYRFRLRARNGAIIVVSEGYTTKTSCENGIESVRRNADIAEIPET